MNTFSYVPLALVLASAPAFGDILITFDEGAPKDRFTIKNHGECPFNTTRVTIDLSGSDYGLIFDVTGQGAGVAVSQPFELTTGEELLSSLPVVKDGDTEVTLDLNGLGVGQEVAFTIDIDDTALKTETTVSGWEITGATVRVENAGVTFDGTFGVDASAKVSASSCIS